MFCLFVSSLKTIQFVGPGERRRDPSSPAPTAPHTACAAPLLPPCGCRKTWHLGPQNKTQPGSNFTVILDRFLFPVHQSMDWTWPHSWTPGFHGRKCQDGCGNSYLLRMLTRWIQTPAWGQEPENHFGRSESGDKKGWSLRRLMAKGDRVKPEPSSGIGNLSFFSGDQGDATWSWWCLLTSAVCPQSPWGNCAWPARQAHVPRNAEENSVGSQRLIFPLRVVFTYD